MKLDDMCFVSARVPSHDHLCQLPFVTGAPLFGNVPGCVQNDDTCLLIPGVNVLSSNSSQCWRINTGLLDAPREDGNSQTLHEMNKGDHKLGRLTHPVMADRLGLDRIRLVPTFGDQLQYWW